MLRRAGYWGKQLIGVGCGLSCGVTAVTGAPPFMLFGSLIMILSAGVLRSAGGDLTVERRWELVQDGLFPAVGTFLLTWTLAYSTISAPPSV